MDKEDNKIMVKLKWGLDETKVNFVNKGIRLVESFILNDIYLIKSDVDAKKVPNSQILKNSIILRECIGNTPYKTLIYKDKNNLNSYCPVIDIDKTLNFMMSIGYFEGFRIEQENLEYEMDDVKIFIEYIADIGLFLKIENNKSIEEINDVLNELQIAYYKDDLCVKKANLMIDKMKKRG